MRHRSPPIHSAGETEGSAHVRDFRVARNLGRSTASAALSADKAPAPTAAGTPSLATTSPYVCVVC